MTTVIENCHVPSHLHRSAMREPRDELAGMFFARQAIHVAKQERSMTRLPNRVWPIGAAVSAIVAGVVVASTAAHGAESFSSSPAAQVADSAEVAAVVDRFHRALAMGDSAAALALLAPDAVILEAGNIETRDEYRAHHLPADIAFARAVPRERGPIQVTVHGDVAWAASSSTSRGEFQGRAINSAGAELVVLVRTDDGWRIAAIHWSSRALRS
jgi:uncharacterized protein (TIGR02246 family)